MTVCGGTLEIRRQSAFLHWSKNLASNLPIVLTVPLICFFLCPSFELDVAACSQSASAGASNRLELVMGLSIKLSSAFEASLPDVLTTTIRALGDDAYFYPLVSSPSFYSTNASHSLGFSLGFLAMSDSDFYLAVCRGISGQPLGYLAHKTFGSFEMLDGYVTPVWLANPNEPLTCSNFSLDVVNVGGSNRLQLRGGEHTIIWSVENAGMIEMQDTGDLLIYDSQNMSNITWRSSMQSTSTLFQEQRLRVGMTLTSNNSAYTAQIERGGLLFYLNTAQFAAHASRYWVFSIMHRNVSSNCTLKDYVSSSPCPASHNSVYTTLAKSHTEVFLNSGICQSKVSTTMQFADLFSMDWNFLRLENDGKLYAYAVARNLTDNSFSTKSYTLDSTASSQWKRYSNHIEDDDLGDWQSFSWGNESDVSMGCGSLGMCRPDATDMCTPSVNPVNAPDSLKGCKRAVSPPPCKSGDEHINTTGFLQLDNLTTTFRFNSWPFTSSASVDACKQRCIQNCSCNGFFYEVNKNNCFFITDQISLHNVTNQEFTFTPDRGRIWARSYIVYLKVVSATNTLRSSHGKRTDKNPYEIPVAATNTSSRCGSKRTLIILLITFVPSSIVTVLGIGLCLMRNGINKQAEANNEELQDIFLLLPARFSYKDLHEATNGFTKELGAGASGSVYAGVLSDGRKVAVKIFASSAEWQAKQEFLAEIRTVGHTNHVNVVSLVGYCCETSHRLLVYEQAERGSLDKWLFTKKDFPDDGSIHTSSASTSEPLLDWQTRYNVALGIARGLSYLHEDCSQSVLHLDIKPQNIILDSAFTAKLADFGMSRIMKRGSSQIETPEVKGTPGYMAPELISHGILGKQCDVYSMGMVMLEIVGGRRHSELTLSKSALDSNQPEAWQLSSWISKNCEKGLMMELVDDRLKMSVSSNMEQVQTLIYTALWCIQENSALRPSASEVVQWLEGRCPVKLLPFMTPTTDTGHQFRCRTI